LSGRDIHFLDAQSGSLLEVVEDAHDGEILDITWAPVKFQLAGGRTTAVLGTCGSDNLVRLWRSPKA
jgi:WD40 repeat protein